MFARRLIEKHVSQAGLDFTLGYYYYRQDRRNSMAFIIRLIEPDVTIFPQGPFEATPHKKWCGKAVQLFKNISCRKSSDNRPPATGRILAHTHEFVKFALTTAPARRSGARIKWRDGFVLMRVGLIRDILIELRWKFYNLNRHESVDFAVGERMGQVRIFHHTGEVEGKLFGRAWRIFWENIKAPMIYRN